MGRVFLNIKTGQIFETNKRKKKPPSQEWQLLGKIDYRHRPREYEVKTFFCPKCREFHAVFHLQKLPLYKQVFAAHTPIWGCAIARDIVKVGQLGGGKKIHYDKAVFIVLNPEWNENKQKLNQLSDEDKKRFVKQLIKNI